MWGVRGQGNVLPAPCKRWHRLAQARQASSPALAAHQVNLSRGVARHLQLVWEVGELVGSQVDSLRRSGRGTSDGIGCQVSAPLRQQWQGLAEQRSSVGQQKRHWHDGKGAECAALRVAHTTSCLR